jgi:uncharacterized protein YukE
MSPSHRPDPEDNQSRNESWSLLGLSVDPTKGDSAGIRLIAYQLQDRADSVDRIRGKVQAMMTDESLMAWIGASGDAFRKTMEPFPGQLATVHQAYSDASAAMNAYANALDNVQWDASGAYSRGSQAWQVVNVSPGDSRLQPVGSDGAFRSTIDTILQNNPAAKGNPTVPDQVMGARRDAENAAGDWDKAGRACKDALEKAADLMSTAVASGALSFDDQLSQYGGKSSDLVMVQHGDAAFVAAVDKTLADYAKKDADDLAKALAHPDDPQSKAIFAKVGADLVNAENDPAYLQAFYGAGGADSTAKLVMQLSPADGTDLSSQQARDAFTAKDLIAQYAAGIAAATRLADLGEVQLPKDVWEPLWRGGPNIPPTTLGMAGDDDHRTPRIPAALLLAFGPSGDHYGHTFLADVGNRILQYDPGERPEYVGDDQPDRYRHLQYNTWSLAPDILKRVGENPAACRDLLDPSRSSAANVNANYKSLLYDLYKTPWMPDDNAAATIIHNATTDITGHPDSSLAATGALFHNLNGHPLTPGLAMAVSQASAAHLDSLMQDATNKMVDGQPIPPGIIPLSPHEMDNVLKSFAGDSQAVQNIDGAIGSKALGLSRLGDFGTGNGTTADMEALKQLGNLQGDINLHQQQAGVDVAHQQDKTNAMYQSWIRTVTGEANVFGDKPWKALHNGQPLAAPFYDAVLPTNNAAKAAKAAAFSLSAGASALDVPLVQGMIDRGQITPPPGASWFQNGLVDLSSPDARNQFNYWHDHQQGSTMDLVRTLSNTVTTGYNQSGMGWNIN